MQSDSYPVTRDLVLIGGGHTHALLLRRWGMAPMPGVRLTLISPDPTAPYTGMVPGMVAGHYAEADLQIDLVRLTRFAGARLVPGRAVAIDRVARRITVPGRPPIAYDVASLDIGITTDLPDLPGFADHGHPAKPLDLFAADWQLALARFATGEAAEIAVIGGGVGGVELALAMAHRVRALAVQPQIVVLEQGAQALTALGAGARGALLRHLAAAGVQLHAAARVIALEPGCAVLADGRRVLSHFTVSAAGAQPQGWLASTGLALHQGFVTVTPTLQSVTDPLIFAAGDCAHMAETPRPKAGVFAVRQAPVLLANLRAALSGGTMIRYRPQRDYLRLISTGGKRAIADRSGWQVGGRWVWAWKDRIDRRFMARFQDLPGMAAPVAVPTGAAAGLAEILAQQPLCGGCGAKVGRADLEAALANLPPPRRADVLSGAGDDAAVLRHGTGVQVLTTDHLRSVTADPWLMARIAAVHALGDIWAMGAVPQVALSQVILPRMSATLQARTLAEITAAAAAVFGGEGADLVGGHTSVGAELTIGFTVTGLAPGAPVAKGGAVPGDVLVLTKALGSGIVLAADMAGLAPGDVVVAAHRAMLVPQGAAARLLAPVAHAMTDVTGFGLAGHLGEMLAASGAGSSSVGARLDLAALPLLPGALALATAGVRSSLDPQNRAFAPVTGLVAAAARDPGRLALLFDPQTCGGLLAAVPGAAAARLVAALQALGLPAAVIGTVVAGPPVVAV